MVDSTKLKQAMKQSESPEEWVADRLKLAQSSLNLKINNKRSFTIKEMFTISDLLGLNPDQMREIFFAESVA